MPDPDAPIAQSECTNSKSPVQPPSSSSSIPVPQPKVQPHRQRNNGNNKQDDEEAPPLQLPCSRRRLDAFFQVDVALGCVIMNALRCLFSMLYPNVVQHDRLIELDEELAELLKRALDLLDVVVAGTDGAEGTGGVATTVGLELQRWQISTCHRSTVRPEEAGSLVSIQR